MVAAVAVGPLVLLPALVVVRAVVVGHVVIVRVRAVVVGVLLLLRLVLPRRGTEGGVGEVPVVVRVGRVVVLEVETEAEQEFVQPLGRENVPLAVPAEELPQVRVLVGGRALRGSARGRRRGARPRRRAWR